MRINSYDFGVMTIDGVEYADDLVVCGNHVRPKWWRRAGHRLDREDIFDILQAEPEVLVVGQGASGMMKVPASTQKALRQRGIELIADCTGRAWRAFNQQVEEGKKVAGAFHLTC